MLNPSPHCESQRLSKRQLQPPTLTPSITPSPQTVCSEVVLCRLVRLYDERQGAKDCGVLRGHRDNVRDVRLSPDGVRLVSAASDKFVRVWDLRAQRQCLSALQMHGDSVWALEAADEELRTFYSGGRDGQVCPAGHSEPLIHELGTAPCGTSIWRCVTAHAPDSAHSVRRLCCRTGRVIYYI